MLCYVCTLTVGELGAGGLLSLCYITVCLAGELGACALAAVSPSLCYVTVYS